MKRVAVAFAVWAGLGHAALAVPVLGTDNFVPDPTIGVICNGNLAVGVTCNNNVSLSGVGRILWDGGPTADFLAVPAGTVANDVQLISSIGQTYSFTSAFGNYTGTIQSIITGGFGDLLSLTDFLTGTFTPLFGGFTPGSADLAIAYTQATVSGITSWSVSDTIRSPADVPEPTTLATLGVALLAFWAAFGWRNREGKPTGRSASAI